MSAAHPVFHAFGDYVQLEANSPIKHEYLAGQICPRAGGTPEHAALAMAVGAKLTLALERGALPCLQLAYVPCALEVDAIYAAAEDPPA